MAAKRQLPTLQGIGPSESGQGGFGPVTNPPNPSDAIVYGAKLPVVMPVDMTQRRDFSEATRPPLHYLDGPGPDEGVTSRLVPPAPRGDSHKWAMDNFEKRPIQGPDNSRYTGGPNQDKTSQGVEIRGT